MGAPSIPNFLSVFLLFPICFDGMSIRCRSDKVVLRPEGPKLRHTFLNKLQWGRKFAYPRRIQPDGCSALLTVHFGLHRLRNPLLSLFVTVQSTLYRTTPSSSPVLSVPSQLASRCAFLQVPGACRHHRRRLKHSRHHDSCVRPFVSRRQYIRHLIGALLQREPDSSYK